MLSRFKGAYSRGESGFYDRFIAPATLAATQPLLARIAETAPSGGAVLDVGCGGGQTLHSLASRRRDLRLVGVDPSPGLLDRARKRLDSSRRVRLLAGSAGDLPGADGEFDAVVSLFAIKHWPGQAGGVAECARVLCPGGRFLVAELDAEAAPEDWAAFVRLTVLPHPVKRPYAAMTLRPFVRNGLSAGRLGDLARGAQLDAVETGSLPGLAIAYAFGVRVAT